MDMSNFILDDESFDKITQMLPDLETLATKIMKLSPDLISMKCPVDSNIPVAAVCLQDVLNTLLSVRIALREYHSNRIWYREKSNPPNEDLAIIMMKYYIDDAVSRLYSAAEHLANAIIFMLDVSDDQLKPYRENRTSQQSIVGHYLVKELPNNPVTHAVINLARSAEWTNTMSYRNNWVHDQPPTIKGLGIVYRRARRWDTRVEDGKTIHTLGLGGGDGAEFAVDDIINFVEPATFLLAATCDAVVDFYVQTLGNHGIKVTDAGLQIDFFGTAKAKPTNAEN
jgi:hypothetical protein